MRSLILIAGLFLFTFTGNLDAEAETISYDLSDLSTSRKLYTDYVLTSLLPYQHNSYTINQNTLTIDCEYITNHLCNSLSQLDSIDPKLDFSKLTSTWLEFFLESRVNRGNDKIMLDDLADFSQLSQFSTWPSTIVQSRIKRSRRKIYRGTINTRKVSVAETLSSTGAVRETEVAIERIHKPGDYEFYTYNDGGQMVLESEFPAGIRPSPSTCVSCHLSRQGKANRFFKP